jgi:hypothetical protein
MEQEQVQEAVQTNCHLITRDYCTESVSGGSSNIILSKSLKMNQPANILYQEC